MLMNINNQDCGFLLELKLDDDEPNTYWIREI